MRPAHRPGRHFDRLHGHADGFAGVQQRAGDGRLHAKIGCERSQVEGPLAESRRREARAHVSESSTESEIVIASGRLKARKSTSGSGRSTRNGRTTSRLVARARGTSPASARDIDARRSVAMSSADWWRSSRFFAKAEQLIVETLAAERVDFERFDDAVALLAAEVPTVSRDVGLDPSASSALHEALSSWQLPIAGARDVGAAFSELLSLHLESIYRPLALWWTDGSTAVEPSCLFSKGLPTPDRFPAFLNGAWAHHQWRVALPRDAVPEGDVGDGLIDERLSFRSAAATDVGRKRANNEDGYIERPEVGLWVVADGMGGHRNGEVASRMVCDALVDFQPDGSFEEAIAGATKRVQDVNEHLYRSAEGADTLDRSGSTVVVMLARGSQLALLWAGDSRLYRWREGKLDQLSRDHSLAELTGSTIVESNIITRAVGIQADLTLDLYRDSVQPDDRFLLCSDGLTRVVSDGRICELMGASEIQSTVGGLINAALEAGGPDNVTVLVAEAILQPLKSSRAAARCRRGGRFLPAWTGRRPNPRAVPVRDIRPHRTACSSAYETGECGSVLRK